MKKSCITTQDDDVVRVDDTLVYDPYNPINVEITLSEVQSILARYGLPPIVHNMQLYKRAFIHRSYTKRPLAENLKQNITLSPPRADCLPLRTKSNERMEFLGDGVLECVTKYCLYRRFPKENEGFMTKTKIAIVNNEAIGKIAFDMGLHKWVNISRNAEESKIRTNLKRLGCLFESFIGALFLDMNHLPMQDDDQWFNQLFMTGPGFHMAQVFIENVFAAHINWTTLIETDENYKNILQVRIQKEFKVTPHYIEIDPPIDANGYRDLESGYNMGVYLCTGQKIHSVLQERAIPLATVLEPASTVFTRIQSQIVENNGKIFICLGSASHKIKRKAEQQACQHILQLLDGTV